MIVKCVKCKDDFIVNTPQTKFCDFCKITKKCERDKRYKKITREIKNLKCKFCGNNTDNKKYCSNTCKTKFWNKEIGIIKAENQIIKQTKKIEFLRSLE